MKNLFRKCILNKIDKNSIYLGIVKGYNVPTLPKNVEIILNNIYVRILRFIGGLCLLIVLTSSYSGLPKYLQLMIIIAGCLQSIQIIMIICIKLIDGIYTLKYKPKEFEVRN